MEFVQKKRTSCRRLYKTDIAHRPNRFVSRCAMMHLVIFWPRDTKNQPSATSPLFFDNLHLGKFARSVNHQSRLTLLANFPKWRLSKKRGLVADGCKKNRYRTSTESIRQSMCDDESCDFLAKRYKKTDIANRLVNRIGRCAMMHVVIFWPKDTKKRYRKSTGESNRSMCDDACCDFLAKRYKTHIAHRPSRFVSRCAMMHVVISGQEIQKQISHIDWRIESVDVRWCILWFFWPSDTKADIAHRLANRSMCDDACCDFSGQEIQKTDIAHRLANRSMCDDACCDFSGQEIQKNRYRTSTGESNRSMCDDARCDFSGQAIQKTDIAHRPNLFVGRCAMMHVVIFLAKRYKKQISHIDWIDSSVDVRWCMLWFSGQEIQNTYRTST